MSSPFNPEGAFLAVSRDAVDRTLYAVWDDGHEPRAGERPLRTRTIARAVSTDPSDENHFRWLVESAAAFHGLQLALTPREGEHYPRDYQEWRKL